MASAWQTFLETRKRLINEFRAEGKTHAEIRDILSMDLVQVYLISDDSGKGNPPPADVKEAFDAGQKRLHEVMNRVR